MGEQHDRLLRLVPHDFVSLPVRNQISTLTSVSLASGAKSERCAQIPAQESGAAHGRSRSTAEPLSSRSTRSQPWPSIQSHLGRAEAADLIIPSGSANRCAPCREMFAHVSAQKTAAFSTTSVTVLHEIGTKTEIRTSVANHCMGQVRICLASTVVANTLFKGLSSGDIQE